MSVIAERITSPTIIPANGIEEGRVLFSGISRNHGLNYFSVHQKLKDAPENKSWTNRFHPLSSLDQITKSIQGKSDYFISQATFIGRSRVSSNVSHITSVFVDLDTYSLGLSNDDETIKKLIDYGSGLGIPEPSMVSCSGRGLYLRWLLDAPLTATSLEIWKKTTSLLCNVYAAFGADKKVRDVSRVLRLVGTTNSKVENREDNRVRIVYGNGVRHNFEALNECLAKINFIELFSSASPSILTARSINVRLKKSLEAQQVVGEAVGDLGALQEFSLTHEPILLTRGNLTHLNWSRFLDLRDLAHMRGGIKAGMRDNYLFWMASSLALAKIVDESNFWEEMAGIMRAMPGNGRDFNPMADGSMSTLISKIEKASKQHKIDYDGMRYNPIYTASNDYLINVFEIKDEEMAQLRTIISHKEKLRRSDEKNPGRAERREERTSNQSKATQMRLDGASLHQIAKELNVHKSTVSRWLNPTPPEDQSKTPTVHLGKSRQNQGIAKAKLRAAQQLAARLHKEAKSQVKPSRVVTSEPKVSDCGSARKNSAPKRFARGQSVTSSGLDQTAFYSPKSLPAEEISRAHLPIEARDLKLFEPPPPPDIPSLNQMVVSIMRAKGMPIPDVVAKNFESGRPGGFASLLVNGLIPPDIIEAANVEQALAIERRAFLVREAQHWQHELKASLSTESTRLRLIRAGKLKEDPVIRQKIADVITGKTYLEKVGEYEVSLQAKRAVLNRVSESQRIAPTQPSQGQSPSDILNRHIEAIKRRVAARHDLDQDESSAGANDEDDSDRRVERPGA